MNMKKSVKILSLSAAALLAVVVLIVIVRRRGRKESDGSPMSGNPSISNSLNALTGKKINLKESKQNAVTAIYYNDFNNYYYFDKTLRYVVIPPTPDRVDDEDGKVFVEIVAVGYLLPNGRLKRTVLSNKCYISQSLLEGEE